MVDLKKTCRTCMRNNMSLVDLFGPVKIEENCTLKLADVLEVTTALNVSKEDGLPQNLCNECVKILQIVYTFRTQALTVEAELKKLIILSSNVKDEKEADQIDDWNNDYLDPYELLNDVIPKNENLLDEKVYICDVCKKKYVRHKRFLKHLLTHEKPKYQCPTCNKAFRKETTFKKHLSTHCKIENCDYINRELHDKANELQIDVKVESNIEHYKCSDCSEIFTEHKNFILHNKKHEEDAYRSEKPFKCVYCNKGFTRKTILRRHIKLHSKEKPFKCTNCSKSYSRQDQLNSHIRKHNGDKPHVCPHCPKAFSQICNLKDHVRIHTGEIPFLCSECGKGFNNSSNLRQHLKRHSGLKPFSCKLCPKTFCSKGQMVGHMATHTGAHPYKCMECGATFTKPNSLKKHKLIHLGVRPFGCDTCKMKFTCKDHLKRHQRIHTGEKPYQCSHCERAFTQSNDLVKHLRSHMGQNIYECTVCHMKFRLLRELKVHYPIHYINGESSDCIDKDLLLLKDCPTESVGETPAQPHPETRIMITFNTNDPYKPGMGDVTINILPDKVN